MTTVRRHALWIALVFTSCGCLLPAAALAAPRQEEPAPATGGVSPEDPALRPPGKAKLVNGVAIPPKGAPPEVVQAITAANAISTKPYRYGGGHASFEDTAYDCSGAVSAVLGGAGLLDSPLDSRLFMRWGDRGRGRWITVYTNPGHAYVVIAGLRFDTGGRDRAAARGGRAGSGPRWGAKRSPQGYITRHPPGF